MLEFKLCDTKTAYIVTPMSERTAIGRLLYAGYPKKWYLKFNTCRKVDAAQLRQIADKLDELNRVKKD